MYPAGIFFLLFGFVMVKFITCYSDGTLLTDECQGMNVNHDGIAAQTTESPFTVTPEQKTFTDSEIGNEINVTLSGTAGNTFIGFMLEARKCETCPPAGTFSLTDPNTTVLLTCDGQNGRAVSHADNLDKSSITVKWIVPEAGTFFFRAAVTQTYGAFWLRKAIILTTTAPKTTPTPKNISANSTTTITSIPAANSTANTTANDSSCHEDLHDILGEEVDYNSIFNGDFSIFNAASFSIFNAESPLQSSIHKQFMLLWFLLLFIIVSLHFN
ncbi:putative ferric-chelate reductase 1 [Misgurnus anguillicaudatus]|uniref:putative ferric-chelate reductase 1 n=1 Tax=Misgurnus anguillicaudatus TaxID=75329 RepID=UPI003CCF99BE